MRTAPANRVKTSAALALFVGSLLSPSLASAAPAPPPSSVSDGVVHYDLSKVPTTPGRCIVFSSDVAARFEAFGPCGNRTLASFLGPKAEGNGGLAVAFGADGREWRVTRREHEGEKLGTVLASMFRAGGLEPLEALVARKGEGPAALPTTEVRSARFTAKEAPTTRIGGGVAFTVAGFDYGVVVTGPDAATVEADLALATSAVGVEASPNVARYSPQVARVVAFVAVAVVVGGVVTFGFLLSARAKKKRESAAAAAMAASWKDRAPAER